VGTASVTGVPPGDGPRAPGAGNHVNAGVEKVAQPPLSLTSSDAIPLNRKQQEKLHEQIKAGYWSVIMAWRGHPFTREQREAPCHKAGLEAMIANGVTNDELREKLAKLSSFERRTFNVSDLYLKWWNNLDEQPAKPNGKAPTREEPRPARRNFTQERREEQTRLAATGTDDLSAYGHSDFDVYKGNGPEVRRELALLADTVPDSYWEK
jgi:hypothetical protein